MRIVLCLLLLAATCLAQDETNAPPPNYIVQFYGVNANGYPQFWPSKNATIATNEPTPSGWYLFTPEQYADLLATNLPAFTIAKSNRLYATKQTVSANLAALVTSYSNLQWAADNWASVTNIATLRIAVKACGDTLLRLKPVLSDLYRTKPE